MISGAFSKLGSVVLGTALLAACASNGSQPFSPAAAQQSGAAFNLKPGAIAHPDRSVSWMKAAAKSSAILYVTDAETYDVYAYSWPQLQLVGTLTGFNGPSGACIDKAGDVWVINTYASQAIEYAHGGTTPIATLAVTGQYPYSCAVDDATGDLAVGNIESASGGAGSVTVFAGATGSGTNYPDKNFYLSFVTYHNKTLYVDGSSGNGGLLQSLKKDGKFKTMKLSQGTINVAGGLQYADGSLTAGDQFVSPGNSAIYQVNKSGAVTGTTSLTSGACGQYVIDAKLVACPNANGKNVLVYAYPAGGAATQTITGSFEQPFAAVISK